MKHTTEELLLATNIRSLVAQRFGIDIPQGLTAEGVQKWKEENLAKYVGEAMDEISATADMIKKSLAASE